MRRSHILLLLLAAVCGGALRVAWLDQRLAERPTAKGWRVKADPRPPYDRVKWTHDEWLYYLSTAVNAFEGRGFFPDYDRVQDGVFVPPPGESLLLLGLFHVTGQKLEPRTLLLLQMVLAAALLPPLWYGIGRRLASPAAGLALAFAVGLHPDAVYWSAYLLSESNYLLGFSLVLYVLVRYAEDPRAGLAVAAGLALGALHLLRPNALLMGPLLALAVVAWLGARRGLLPGLLLLALPFLVVVPWLLRNLSVSGEPILVSSNAGVHLYLANHPGLDPRTTPYLEQVVFDERPFIPELEKKYRKVRGRLRVTYYEYSQAYGTAFRAYLREQPLHFARNYLRKLWNLFALVQEGPRAATPVFRDFPSAYAALHLLTVAGGLLGLLALAAGRCSAPAAVLALVFAYLVATGALSMPSSDGRYGLLLQPVLLALACAGTAAAPWGARRGRAASASLERP